MIFPSEGQRGHSEPENNSASHTLYMTGLRYRWRQLHLFNMRFSSEALRPNQANTQLYTLDFFFKLLLLFAWCLILPPPATLKTLSKPPYAVKKKESSGPSPSSVLSGAFIYLVNTKPETTCEQKGSTQWLFVLLLFSFLKENAGK